MIFFDQRSFLVFDFRQNCFSLIVILKKKRNKKFNFFPKPKKMSDDDGDFGYGYSSGEDPENKEDYELENNFFEADDIKKTNPKEAIERFETIILMEESKGSEVKWKFKCLLNIIQLKCRIQNFADLKDNITQIVKIMNTVSRNDSNEAISLILDSLTQVKESHDDLGQQLMDHLSLNLEAYEHLWLSAALKLARIYLKIGDFIRLEAIIEAFKTRCKTQQGLVDEKKSGALLELYSIEIQICIANKDHQRMKGVYEKTKNLSSAIVDPKSMAIIKETSGKLLMIEKKWKESTEELVDAFKFYQEVGNPQAKTVLKYLVLAGMLSMSEINIFCGREARVYKDDPEILAMQEMRNAFELKDLKRFDRILKDKTLKIDQDEFMKSFLDDLMKVFNSEKIISMIVPYKTIKIEYLAKELSEKEESVVKNLSLLIMEGKILGKIDKINGYYENLEKPDLDELKKEEAMKNWINTIQGL